MERYVIDNDDIDDVVIGDVLSEPLVGYMTNSPPPLLPPLLGAGTLELNSNNHSAINFNHTETKRTYTMKADFEHGALLIGAPDVKLGDGTCVKKTLLDLIERVKALEQEFWNCATDRVDNLNA